MGIGGEVMRRAVFLDRDGVINRAVVREGKPYPPATLEDLEVLPGVAEALWLLRRAGFLLIVVTNQPDVARGTVPRSLVDTMNAHIKAILPIDEVLTCFHDGADQCECRKPKPGMLLEAANRYTLDLATSFMVGDRWRDIDAGVRAGCKTFFIDYGYAERQPDNSDYRVRSLSEAAEIIVQIGIQK